MRAMCGCGVRQVISYRSSNGERRYSKYCYKCAAELAGTRRLGPPTKHDSPICPTCNYRHCLYHSRKSGEKIYRSQCKVCITESKITQLDKRRMKMPDRPMCECGTNLVSLSYKDGVRFYNKLCTQCLAASRKLRYGTTYRPMCRCGKDRTTYHNVEGVKRVYLDLCRGCIAKGEVAKPQQPINVCTGCRESCTEFDSHYTTLCNKCVTLIKTERRAFPGITPLLCTECNTNRATVFIKGGKRYFRDTCAKCAKASGRLGRQRISKHSDSLLEQHTGKRLHILWPKDLPTSTDTLICPHRYEFLRRFNREYGIDILPAEIMQWSATELEQILKNGFRLFYATANECPPSFTYFFSVKDRATFAKCFPFIPMRLHQLWHTVVNYDAMRKFIFDLAAQHTPRQQNIVTVVEDKTQNALAK